MARPRGYRLNPEAFDDLLHAAGIKAANVAERADVSKGTLSSLAKGDHGAALPVVLRIAKALNAHPATLFPELIGTPAARRQRDDLPVIDEDAA